MIVDLDEEYSEEELEAKGWHMYYEDEYGEYWLDADGKNWQIALLEDGKGILSEI